MAEALIRGLVRGGHVAAPTRSPRRRRARSGSTSCAPRTASTSPRDNREVVAALRHPRARRSSRRSSTRCCARSATSCKPGTLRHLDRRRRRHRDDRERACPTARASSARCRTRPRWSAPARPRSARGKHASDADLATAQRDVRRGRHHRRARREPARRGHRPVRLGPRVHLPDPRGARRRRRQGRPVAPQRAAPRRADRDGLGQDAARDRRASRRSSRTW